MSVIHWTKRTQAGRVKTVAKVPILDNNKQVNIRPKEFMWVLGVMTGLLVMAHLVAQFMRFVAGHSHLYGLYRLFNLGSESNIPTYFSALILGIAALLLAIIATCKKNASDPYMLHWAMLSVGFFCLSVDEAAQIHELLGRPTREILGDQAGQRPWIIPGIALSLIVAGFYLRFLLHLPLRSKLLFVAAGVLYLGGAIGIEFAAPRGDRQLALIIFQTVEETLEMAGILLFIHSLLKYIETNLGGVQLYIGSLQLSLLAEGRKTQYSGQDKKYRAL